jgi:ATP-dependent NAD(P)H-hydrate dehydratase
VLVVGPGLGRDATMHALAARALAAARSRSLPVVLDADALRLAAARPELVRGRQECVLTPNVREFAVLCDALGVSKTKEEGDGAGAGESEGEQAARRRQCAALARALGGVTVLAKGRVDVISDGATTLECAGEGAPKRSGGQGDTLTGVLGTLLAWRRAYLERLWEHDGALSATDSVLLCAYASSAITRECSRLAFRDKGRSLQASDLTDKVRGAFLNTLGEPGMLSGKI